MPAKNTPATDRTSPSTAGRGLLKVLPGRIYVLGNAHMQHLVKIGKTSRSVERRAMELARGSGVPGKFDILVDELVADPDRVERLIHSRLDPYRVKADREFFEAPKPLVMRTTFAVCAQVNREVVGRISMLRLDLGYSPDAALIKSLMSPHRSSQGVAVVVHYHNGAVEVDVGLGADWRVQVSVELISILQDAFGVDRVAIFTS